MPKGLGTAVLEGYDMRPNFIKFYNCVFFSLCLSSSVFHAFQFIFDSFLSHSVYSKLFAWTSQWVSNTRGSNVLNSTILLQQVICSEYQQSYLLNSVKADLPSTLFLWSGGRPFLFLTEEVLLLLLPLFTDILSSSPPVTNEFLYEMSGSQTSSLLSIICSVRNFSRYEWLETQ